MSNTSNKSQNQQKNTRDESGLGDELGEVAAVRVHKSSSIQSDMSVITISSNDSDASSTDNLNYKYRSHIQDKSRNKFWSVEFNNFLKPGQPNIFAVVGGRQFSVYESMSNGKIKLQMCYQLPNPNPESMRKKNTKKKKEGDEEKQEDFYTCCWSVNSTKKRSVLLVAGVLGIIQIFEVERPNAEPYHLIGHTGAVNQLKVSPHQPFLLASASKDNSIRLWNFHTKACIATFHAVEAHRDEVVSIDFNRDCTRLVSGGLDHMIAIWDLSIPEIVETIEKSKRYNEMKSDRAIKTVYHPFPMFSTRQVHHNYIDSVQWHNDFILSKSNEDDLFCWKPGLMSCEEGLVKNSRNAFTKIVEFEVENCNYYFTRFATTYDRSVLALGNSDGMIRLWNLDCADPTNIPKVSLTHRKCTKNVRDISFSHCGRDLIFISDDSTIWLYQR